MKEVKIESSIKLSLCEVREGIAEQRSNGNDRMGPAIWGRAF